MEKSLNTPTICLFVGTSFQQFGTRSTVVGIRETNGRSLPGVVNLALISQGCRSNAKYDLRQAGRCAWRKSAIGGYSSGFDGSDQLVIGMSARGDHPNA
jgi:hypothetical protein